MRQCSLRFSIRTLLIAFVLVALGIVSWPAIWKQWAVYSVDRKGADYVRPAAEALLDHGEHSIPVFAELLKHNDMYVRIVAADQLRELGPDATDAVDVLVAGLHDPGFPVAW